MTMTEIQASVFPQYTLKVLDYRIYRLLARNHHAQDELLLRKRITPEKIEQLKRLHAQGLQTLEIAEVLGLSYGSIGRKTRQLKLDPVPYGRSVTAPGGGGDRSGRKQRMIY